MNTMQIIEELSTKTGEKKKKCKEIIKNFLDIIKEHLQNGEEIRIKGFGTFKVKIRKSRAYYHPKTREKIIAPETKRVTFTPHLGIIRLRLK